MSSLLGKGKKKPNYFSKLIQDIKKQTRSPGRPWIPFFNDAFGQRLTKNTIEYHDATTQAWQKHEPTVSVGRARKMLTRRPASFFILERSLELFRKNQVTPFRF